jgi:hypothetical protein
MLMDVDALRPGFTYLLLERVDLEKNENRFYYLAWQPSLFDQGVVMRMYGRKDGPRRKLVHCQVAEGQASGKTNSDSGTGGLRATFLRRVMIV